MEKLQCTRVGIPNMDGEGNPNPATVQCGFVRKKNRNTVVLWGRIITHPEFD
jgi:hypothetical protein